MRIAQLFLPTPNIFLVHPTLFVIFQNYPFFKTYRFTIRNGESVRSIPSPPPPHQLCYATFATSQHHHLLSTAIALRSNLATALRSNLRCDVALPPPSWPSPSLWSLPAASPCRCRLRLLISSWWRWPRRGKEWAWRARGHHQLLATALRSNLTVERLPSLPPRCRMPPPPVTRILCQRQPCRGGPWPYRLRTRNGLTDCKFIMTLRIDNPYTLYIRVFFDFSP